MKFGKQALAALIILAVSVFLFVTLPLKPPKRVVENGYTFSIHAANALGEDWHQVYTDALRDLHPDIIRIPLYWDLIEPNQGSFDWNDTDQMIAEAKAANTKLVLAIGHKLPRWPECHLPGWMSDKPEEEVRPDLDRMLTAVVNRYKDEPAVSYWQVENEALFPFGKCPSWSDDRSLLSHEIELVRSLDPDTPITTTDSGELSLWLRTSTLPIDAISVSLYRTVYKAGFHRWRINPYAYRLRAWFVRPFVKHLIVSELQTEPWGPNPVQELSDQDIEKSFAPDEFADRFDYASRTGADAVIAWGVEWWYYRNHIQGDSRYWEAAKQFFSRP